MLHRANALLVVVVLLMSGPFASAEAKRTKFDPQKHGFRFINDFTNDFIPALDIRTDGLCGGMSYTALDYYFAGMPTPQQNYRPANRSPLQSYLYNRQVTSIVSNLVKWGELGFNPLGARDSEFFEWGLKGFGGGRLQELRASIDKGLPVPLGLQQNKTGNHQVIAIGYDTGRYKGDLKAFKGDLKIFICDPNYPGQTMTLVPDLANKIYTYQEDRTMNWRTYFVDTAYSRKVPPKIAGATYPNDGLVHELFLTFTTGADDLRGGNDNINLTIKLADGTQQFCPNLNRSARWLPNYTETVSVKLKTPVAAKQIKSLIISDTFSGGIGGDNWDMKSLTIYAVVNNTSSQLKSVGFFRFTGDRKSLSIPVNAK